MSNKPCTIVIFALQLIARECSCQAASAHMPRESCFWRKNCRRATTCGHMSSTIAQPWHVCRRVWDIYCNILEMPMNKLDLQEKERHITCEGRGRVICERWDMKSKNSLTNAKIKNTILHIISQACLRTTASVYMLRSHSFKALTILVMRALSHSK